MEKEWFVIVNPNAGRRKGEKDWKKISLLLTNAGIPFKSIFTTHPNHAENLTEQYVRNGFKKIIVVGGDGTLNEVVNGVFAQTKYPTTDITLAMIPVGTGNDWCRTFGISSEYAEAIKTIVKGNTFIQDAGRVTFVNGEKETERYFVNIAGIGYDAIVAKKTNTQKAQGKGGPFSYLVNMLTSLFKFKPIVSKITVDGKLIDASIFSIGVGICKYNGGGMMQLPDAVPDDGLLDMTVIRKISKFKVIRNVHKLFDGSYVKLEEVSVHRGKQIRIDSETPLVLEADGESLGTSPFVFDIIPKSVKVVVENY